MFTFHSLLIGIDCYMANILPGNSWYPSLGGCVRDINMVENFLRTGLGIDNDRLCVTKLTATYIGPQPALNPHHTYKPTEPPELWPTYENMVDQFRQLTVRAEPGDEVYIHYSGHGGRVATIFPELNKEADVDEALVPTDIGDPDARYLRDVELAHLLETMVEKGLRVTLVLDSCHSGGATRSFGTTVARGISAIDHSKRAKVSLVATHEKLVTTWRRLSGNTVRGLTLGSGWLLEPRGYTLLAAARSQEFAYETMFPDGERHGILTYWWLDALRQRTATTTYLEVYNQVSSKVHGHFETQTPQLEGEADRVVFGAVAAHTPRGIVVERIEFDNPTRLFVRAGQVHGLRKGAQFAVYPHNAADLAGSDEQVAIGELTELGPDGSWITVTQILRQARIEPGAQAVVLTVANQSLRQRVALVYRQDIPTGISAIQGIALEKLRQALVSIGSNWFSIADTDKEGFGSFQVIVSEQGYYEVWDAAGNVLSHMNPPLAISDVESPVRLAQRLIHLAKFRIIHEIENFDPASRLAGRLVLEVLGKAGPDYDPTDAPCPQPFDFPGTPTLKNGEWLFVRIRNTLPRSLDPMCPWLNTLNVVMFDLAPDWSVTQLYPNDAGSDFFALDGDSETQPLPLRMSLPEGDSDIVDIIKVFATRGPTSFRWLQLPVLDRPIEVRSQTDRYPQDLCDNFQFFTTEGNLALRHIKLATDGSHDWTTVQIEVRTIA